MASRKTKKSTSGSSIKIQRPEANTHMRIIIIPQFSPDDPRSKIARSPNGNKGNYCVTFVLAVPGREVFRDELNFEKIMKSGSSLLQASPNVQGFRVNLSNQNDTVEILLKVNPQGMLATAQMQINAQNFEDAERTAFNLVSPQLSYWSFVHDVALDIAGYETIEENTGTRKYSFGVMGKIKTLNHNYEFISTEEYRKFFATYREAMNSTNVFYQALSFYKIAEGVNALRKRISRRENTTLPVYPNERIPNNLGDLPIYNNPLDELTQDSFKPYLGLDFDLVLEKLRGTIRNAIAHLGQLDDILDGDKFDDVSTCMKVVPILKFIARTKLQNDLETKTRA